MLSPTVTLLQNASIPTRVEYDHIGNLRVVRRNFDQKSYAASSDTWLSCTLLTGGAHLVDLVTVHWEGGLFGLITNQTELNSLYTRITTRNVSTEQITTRLRLTSPILDSRAYGEYRCVFGFPSPKNIFARVYLHVPPILRLVYDPPPLPPANFSNRFSCTDPPCRALTDESNISDSAVVNWTSACEVLVAYPPVLPDGLTWTWTNSHWAAYAVQRVQSVGKSAYLSELKSMVVDKNEPVSPWQILDRRRRNAQALDLYYMNISEQPPGPVVFLCWAKNVLGESAVWWPGPIQDTGSSFWASVWWPVVGVSLELASLLIVVGLFRCCSRAGRLRSFSAARSTENTSFGLSRLFDTERQADSSYRQQETVKRTTQLRSPGKVPYVRLSNIARPEADEHDSSVLDQHTGNGARMHCHVNPLLEDDQTEAKQATNGRDGDEYFWDSDAEPSVPVNRN
ncbi:hypothetical protein CRM22_002574 [Opisthorchis felineus]|uniref:Uncharacterized protein n=1 Tax=Opisthorchis felineus TaxID=147828 RepID=A0A4S2M5C0_OPIFE|nr:hypothetical protein CRM22_002574 [Opisthorchis felineus]